MICNDTYMYFQSWSNSNACTVYKKQVNTEN